MDELMISCPNCGIEFPLSSGMIDNIRKDVSKEIKTEVMQQLQEENDEQIKGLKDQIDSQKKQIRDLKTNELDLLKKKEELEEKEHDIDLEVKRKINLEKEEIEKKTSEKISEEFHLKEREKDKQIEDFQKQVDDLKRKLDQKSQQLIGEVAELELEDILKQHFPLDDIKTVGQGQRGADVIQCVINTEGQNCGIIIWESKNTQNWGRNWISKLKEDQRREKADIAVIASVVLPEGIENFDLREGVWVISFKLIYEIALILRNSLIELNRIRVAQIGMDVKVDMLYSYLCGNEFKQRVMSMVEAFTEMQKDLARERRSMEQIWSKREIQLNTFLRNTCGMYGDIKGIIGGALPEIEPIELPQLQ